LGTHCDFHDFSLSFWYGMYLLFLDDNQCTPFYKDSSHNGDPGYLKKANADLFKVGLVSFMM